MTGRGSFILTILILVGLVVGCVAGEVCFQVYDGNVPEQLITAFHFVGNTLFMSLLKMVLVPLVASSVIVGVSSIGDPARLGHIGLMTIIYYVSTMFIAVLLGVTLVTTIRPGDGMEVAFRDQQAAEFAASEDTASQRVQGASGTGWFGALQNIVQQLIPANPLGDAADGKLLPVIAFSLALGIISTMLGKPGRPLIQFFESLFAVMMKMVELILWLAPIGVCALLAWTVARIGLASLLGPLAKFVITVLLGLGIHGMIVLPLALMVFGKANPWHFLLAMRAALLTALGTDSSSATLPVTIDCAEGPGGCSQRAARFVLPLGATVNMDGTALYEAVAVIFLFQCFGISLGGQELAIVAITATLAAIGAAGIPSAGLVTMVIVVEAVNNSLGGEPRLDLSAVGIIWGIDRVLDMCRTVVNVWGDAVGARIITRLAPDDPAEVTA
ncbi:MAG: dicarboxylate/amino acid:cation symporter [Planctomycetota bacterium]